MTDRDTAAAERVQMVSFVVEGGEFGIDILRVREIIRVIRITRVPQAPSCVEGVINLRGRIIPVIDLRTRFQLPSRPADAQTRIVVVEVDGGVVGFRVDAVREVLRVERGEIEPPPDVAVGVDARYITGVAKLEDRLLILLDLDAIMTRDEGAAVASLRDAA